METGAISTASPARQSGNRRKYPSKERKAPFGGLVQFGAGL
jgi:hypothetical protein